MHASNCLLQSLADTVINIIIIVTYTSTVCTCDVLMSNALAIEYKPTSRSPAAPPSALAIERVQGGAPTAGSARPCAPLCVCACVRACVRSCTPVARGAPPTPHDQPHRCTFTQRARVFVCRRVCARALTLCLCDSKLAHELLALRLQIV